MTARETGPNGFKTKFIKRIRDSFPECIVMLTDAGYIQGAPDILVLHHNTWAALEVKASAKASHRPNQDWWVEKLNEHSYAAFVYPENQEEVLNELQFTFGTRRTPRLS